MDFCHIWPLMGMFCRDFYECWLLPGRPWYVLIRTTKLLGGNNKMCDLFGGQFLASTCEFCDRNFLVMF